MKGVLKVLSAVVIVMLSATEGTFSEKIHLYWQCINAEVRFA